MLSVRCARPASRASVKAKVLARLLVAICLALAVASCHKSPAYKIVAAKEGYTHVIAQGDSLESIAEKYYGDAKLGKAIGEYNKLDPLRPLEPGVTLIIPFDTTELERITRVNEGYVSYNRGTMLARTGQYEQAVPYLEKAVDTDPSNADAWYNLAVTYQKMGLPEKALPMLERLTGARPSEKTYLYSYGSVLRKLGRKKEALGAFRRALKLDSKYKDAQYALALTYEDLGKSEQASAAWRRYLELDQDSAWAEEARIHLNNLGVAR